MYYREISKDTTWSLQFKNKELEAKYVQQRESMSSIPLVASLLVLIIGNIYSSIILPSTIYHFLLIAAPIILIVPIICFSVAESFPMVRMQFERRKRQRRKMQKFELLWKCLHSRHFNGSIVLDLIHLCCLLSFLLRVDVFRYIRAAQ